MIPGQTAAILWAQWRAILNYHGRGRRAGFPLTVLLGTVWYAVWTFSAYAIATFAADAESIDALKEMLGPGLLAAFAYWQIVPVFMATAGLSLDLPRLLPYPIPPRQLFTMEVLLRMTTAPEMLLLVGGLGIGLLLNLDLPIWTPAALFPFVALNLFVGAGIRDLMTRLLARKYFRELAVFVLVLIAALPQVLLLGEPSERIGSAVAQGFGGWWPWSLTASLIVGPYGLFATPALLLWTFAAYLFGRRQFDKSLRFDAAERRSSRVTAHGRATLADWFLRLPASILRDPLAVLVEKELRILCRAPRFRLLFLMGFSFGLIIWLPLAWSAEEDSLIKTNYLTIVSAYAIMLLGEVCFWNNFGIDRGAAQTYFVTPVQLSTVLVAKNIVAAFFVLLEVSLVGVVCLLLGMPLTAGYVAEALAVAGIVTLVLLSIGNLLSTRYPRPIDPSQSWRSGSAGRVQFYLLLVYPVAAAPVFLAYGARYAFDSEAAFYAVILLHLVLGSILYWVALESAVGIAQRRKEEIITTLSHVSGPVGS